LTGTAETRADAPGRSGARVIGIVGPTGVGKTALAEELAVHIGGEVVGADSMQVYRGMDVGTAKPPADRRRVPYHCVDLRDPGELYSAALYQADARAAIADISRRGMLPVLVGGTGLYIRAAIDDWSFPAGEAGTPARADIEAMGERLGPEALHAHLASLDPDSAALIHPNNTRRVRRALEMLDEGASYADGRARFAKRSAIYDTLLIGLTMDRAALCERIDARVHAMIASGLLDEVSRLLDAGYHDALTASQAIGYKELVPVITRGTPLEGAVEAIAHATRRYAKRQMTWFRADPRVRWIDVTGLSLPDAYRETLALVESWAGDAVAGKG
jgi:tRNA dimethylallyltransferase